MAWVTWVQKKLAWVLKRPRWHGSRFWHGWRGSIKFWCESKKNDVGGVGWSFGMGLVGLRCFVKKVLLSFAKFTGKHLCWSLLLTKVAGWRPANFLIEGTPAQVFSCELCEIFQNTYFVGRLHTFITMLCLSFFG